MLNYPKDIEVEITFLSTNDGGRKYPARSGEYRPQFYYNGHDWDAIHVYPEKEWVYPGETTVAYLSFLNPQVHIGKIQFGMNFLIREAQRVVAKGYVKRILDLPKRARTEM